LKKWLALVVALALSGCISVGIGGDVPAMAQYRMYDGNAGVSQRAEPLVPALLLQPLAADALADTLSIAYSRRANEFAFYQLASWTERPVRRVPHLLQQRLQARGVAGAVGLIGDPLRADWLLTIGIDTLHHDLSTPPGQARVALTAELFDRRNRVRIARHRFEASVPTQTADSAAAAASMSLALGQTFDALVPWLEAELAVAAPKRP
jgi:cholesterol transport system auxiliary component